MAHRPAADFEDLTGEVPGGRRRQPGDEVADMAGAQRGAVVELLGLVEGQVLGEGVHPGGRVRTDGVDRHVEVAHLKGGGHRQRGHAGLHRPIQAELPHPPGDAGTR